MISFRSLRIWITILSINLIGGLFASGAFLYFLYQSNQASLSLIPAAIALLIFIWQPWFFLLVFLPGGFFIAPAMTTVVTVFMYSWLDRQGRLNFLKKRLQQFKLKKVLLTLLVLGLLLGSLSYLGYRDVLKFDTTVPTKIEWLIKDTQIFPTNNLYYCLYRFIDSAYLWQATLSNQDWKKLAQHLKLEEIEVKKIPQQFYRMPPYWWHPTIEPATKTYSTKHFPSQGRGPDGDYYLATWDPQYQQLHMWVKFNF